MLMTPSCNGFSTHIIPEAQEVPISISEQVISKIRSWRMSNKLNDEKSEVLTISSNTSSLSNLWIVHMRETTVDLKPKVHNLGVIVDNHMTMEDHAQLFSIGHICHHLI